jgi:hypothetical protein
LIQFFPRNENIPKIFFLTYNYSAYFQKSNAKKLSTAWKNIFYAGQFVIISIYINIILIFARPEKKIIRKNADNYDKKRAICPVDAGIWLLYNKKTKGRVCPALARTRASTKASFDN